MFNKNFPLLHSYRLYILITRHWFLLEFIFTQNPSIITGGSYTHTSRVQYYFVGTSESLLAAPRYHPQNIFSQREPRLDNTLSNLYQFFISFRWQAIKMEDLIFGSKYLLFITDFRLFVFGGRLRRYSFGILKYCRWKSARDGLNSELTTYGTWCWWLLF